MALPAFVPCETAPIDDMEIATEGPVPSADTLFRPIRRCLVAATAALCSLLTVYPCPGTPRQLFAQEDVERRTTSEAVGSLAERTRGARPWSGPSARAVRKPEGAEIEVDGRLHERAWEAAPVITGFVQGEPREGARPAQPTEVRFLFDDEAIYVGARLHEEDPGVVRAQMVRRDERGASDAFEVALDPNLDRRTGYLFRVSAAGVERDAYLFDDTEEDENWDAVWDSGVVRDSLGWSVELRIPLSQIRFERGGAARGWGVNFTRRRLASNSVAYFSLESRTQEGKVSQFGRLRGIDLDESPRRLEIEPFLVSQLRTAPSEDGDPLFDGTEFRPRAGADLSLGIGSAFSLDATVNPDFGQVEVDPEVINLSAFETFFPEKRPFFVQDARVFDFDLSGRQNRLFFSRRIGREPRGDVPDEAEFSKAPSQTTILGAAKLTGRTSGGLSVGALAALTDREVGEAYLLERDRVEGFVVEPRSEYGVVRLQQDFRDGGSRIGGILTGAHRHLPATGVLDHLPADAYSLGLDFEHQWGGERSRDWSLWGFAAGSLVRGSERALLHLQTAPNHYFQRPDAEDLEVDSAATSMVGHSWRLQLERQSAEHWTWAAWLGEVSPGFEVNDLGFFTGGEELDVGGRITYREIEPGDVLRNWNIRLFTFHNFRHALLDNVSSADGWTRSYDSGRFSLNGEAEFANNWEVDLGLDYAPRSLSGTRTRGGPLMTSPASVSFDVRGSTDRRADLSVEPSFRHEARTLDAGGSTRFGLELTWRPAPGWELEVGPEYGTEREAAQYVATSGNVGYAPTYGRRYLFADLDRKELSLETRVNVAFTPDLSLQIYAQPLIASGAFVRYKLLSRSESFDFRTFEEGRAVAAGGGVRCEGGDTCVLDGTRWMDFDGDGAGDLSFPDRDFNIRSLQGNAVLRWEYRPGSVLFLVWQQSRRDALGRGDFDLGRDLDGLFAAPAENTFILKVSHYLSL